MDDGPRVPPRPMMANAMLSNLPHLARDDPGLLVTPEKQGSDVKGTHQDENKAPSPRLPSGILKPNFPIETGTSGLKPGVLTDASVDLIPTKLRPVISDPTLDVTPEKLIRQTNFATDNPEQNPVKNDDKSSKNLHVRFDVPDTPRSTEASDETATDSNTSADAGVADPRTQLLQQQPFQKRAALYVRRNPLADITSDSSMQESTDNTTTSSEAFTSNASDNSSLFDQIAEHIKDNSPSVLPDMGGKVIRGDPKVAQTLPEVKLKTVRKTVTKPKGTGVKPRSKIVEVVPQAQKGPSRTTIDQITRPKSGGKTAQLTEGKNFLRKKSGLHRHEHTVRYKPDQTYDESNNLSEPSYNSTLSLGQELQELKISKFDAEAIVKQKLEESETLRNYVAEKTAEATNVDPDEKLYQNLVSVDIPTEGLVPSNAAAWKRLKPKPYKPKETKHPKPDIMDFIDPEELYTDDPCVMFEPVEIPMPGLCQAPLEGIMSLYQRMQIWEGL